MLLPNLSIGAGLNAAYPGTTPLISRKPSRSVVHAGHSVRVPVQGTPIELVRFKCIALARFMTNGLARHSTGSSSCQPTDQGDDEISHECDCPSTGSVISLNSKQRWRQFTANRLDIVSNDTHDRWKYSKNGNGVKEDIPTTGSADPLDRPGHSAAPCSADWSSHPPVPPESSPWNCFSSD